MSEYPNSAIEGKPPVYITNHKLSSSKEMYDAGYCLLAFGGSVNRSTFMFRDERIMADYMALPLYRIELDDAGFVHVPKIEDVRRLAIK